MSTPPYGPGVTARAYAAYYEKFSSQIVAAGQLFAAHPTLRGLEAKITPGHIEIVTIGLPGIEREWIRALPPVVTREAGFFPMHSGLGLEDVLRAGLWTVHVRHPEVKA